MQFVTNLFIIESTGLFARELPRSESMVTIMLLSTCACGLRHMERAPRSFWMRAVPFVRLYRCSVCGTQSLLSKQKVESALRQKLSVSYVQQSTARPVETPKTGVASRTKTEPVGS